MGISSWQHAVESVNGDLRTAFGWESDEYFLYVASEIDPTVLGPQSEAYMIHKDTSIPEKRPYRPGSTAEEWALIDKFDSEMRRCHTKWPSGLPYNPKEDFEDFNND